MTYHFLKSGGQNVSGIYVHDDLVPGLFTSVVQKRKIQLFTCRSATYILHRITYWRQVKMKGTKVQTLGRSAQLHVHLSRITLAMPPVACHADVKLIHALQVDTPRLLAHAL